MLNSQPEEIVDQWMPIPGWENFYEVSDTGRVRSIDRVITVLNPRGVIADRAFKGKELALTVAKNGYRMVSLTRPGRKRYYAYVHRLVMLAFVGECPAGMEVCHSDGERTNNALANLRYDTRKANAADCTQHGNRRCRRGGESPAAKLAQADVERIREGFAEGQSLRSLARAFGVCHSTISNIVKNVTWRANA